MWRRLDRMRDSRFLAACNHNAEVKINSALSHSDNWLNIIYINQISLVCFHISVSKEGKYTTCPFAYHMGLGWRNTVSLGRLCITSQMIIIYYVCCPLAKLPSDLCDWELGDAVVVTWTWNPCPVWLLGAGMGSTCLSVLAYLGTSLSRCYVGTRPWWLTLMPLRVEKNKMNMEMQ